MKRRRRRRRRSKNCRPTAAGTCLVPSSALTDSTTDLGAWYTASSGGRRAVVRDMPPPMASKGATYHYPGKHDGVPLICRFPVFEGPTTASDNDSPASKGPTCRPLSAITSLFRISHTGLSSRVRGPKQASEGLLTFRYIIYHMFNPRPAGGGVFEPRLLYCLNTPHEVFCE